MAGVEGLSMKAVCMAAVMCAAAVSVGATVAHAQPAELGDVSLLSSFDGSAQSAVVEIVNASDHAIKTLTISCQLLDDAGKTIAVKATRFRNIEPGSFIGDVPFPSHVRGVDATCRIVHQTPASAAR